MVTFPANPKAVITGVKDMEQKQVVNFQDLPITSSTKSFDAEAAKDRIRKFTSSGDTPSKDYRKGFLWFDASEPLDYRSYAYPIADVIQGELKAVPDAIRMAADDILGGKSILERDDQNAILDHARKYFEKMNVQAPWEQDAKKAADFVGSVRSLIDAINEDSPTQHSDTMAPNALDLKSVEDDSTADELVAEIESLRDALLNFE